MKSRLNLRACTQMYPNLLIYSVYSIYVDIRVTVTYIHSIRMHIHTYLSYTDTDIYIAIPTYIHTYI